MAITLRTVTGNAADLLRISFVPGSVDVVVTTNLLPGEAPIDLTNGQILLGAGAVPVNTDGTFVTENLIDFNNTSADVNPTGVQYTWRITYRNVATRKPETVVFGPFNITADGDLSELIATQYAPPTWMTTATATLQAYVDEAEDAREAAEAARDAAVDISGISTSDAVVEALVKNTGGAGPLTSAALKAGFIQHLPSPSGGDDIDMLEAAVAAGGYVRCQPGTYLVSRPLVIDQAQWWDLDKRTTFKLMDDTYDPGFDPGADWAGLFAPVIIGANGVAFVGGVIEGNRDQQDKTAFNTAGGSDGGGYLFGMTVQGSEGSPISDLVIDTHIAGCGDSGLHMTHVTDSVRVTVDVSDSGSGVQVIESNGGGRIDVTCRSLNNNGWKIFPHVLDLNQCSDLDVSLTSLDHAGNGTVAGGTSRSDWLSGLTAINCDNITFRRMRLDFRNDNTMSRGLAVSLLSCRALTVYDTRITGATDCAIELGGVVDTHFIGGHVDGRYNTGPSSYAGRGVSFYNIGFVRDLSHRVTRYTDNVTFTDFVIERMMGDALVFEAARDVRFFNSVIRRSQRGVLSKYAANDATDAVAQSPRPITGLKFHGCTFTRNEQSGFDAYDLTYSKFFDCEFNDNGQVDSGAGSDSTHTRNGQTRDTAAAGFKTRTSTSPLGNKVGLEFHGCRFDDTQTFTTYASINPNDPSIISLADDSLFGPGSTVTLTGAGPSGGDLTTMVDDLTLLDAKLHVAASTQPTVAGTGTIASAGKTITGTGTNFNPEFNAQFWITAAGQTRQVTKIASDTSATTDEAFSPALPAGTTFTIHKVTVTGIPSQQWGVLLSADTIAARFFGGTYPTGNVQGAVSDANASTADQARWIGVPNQSSFFGNTVQSNGNLVANALGGSANTLGAVGLGGESALKLGGDLILFRKSSTALETTARITQAGTGKAYAKFTTSGTVGSNRDTVDGDASSGAITLTLTSAASNPGQVFTLRKSDSSGNTVTVACSGGQNIDGSTTKPLSTQYATLRVQSDGTNWIVLG